MILHNDGFVTDCSSSIIYYEKNNKIYTHPATKNILHGCVRMRVEQFAKQLDIPFIEEAFTLEDVPTADEMFLTSTTSEVLPIIKVDDQPIGNAKPGHITRTLQAAYERDANIVDDVKAIND